MGEEEEEEEEERKRSLIKDLKRHARLAVAWSPARVWERRARGKARG